VNQTISFGAPPTVVVGSTGTVTATASSGLAVNLSSATTGICTVNRNTLVIGVTAGTCTINANQAGDVVWYNPAPQVQISFPIGKTNQTISFGTPPTVVVGSTGVVSATASSTLAVNLSSATTGICSVSGNTVTGVKAGTCTINANQSGNVNYIRHLKSLSRLPLSMSILSIIFTTI
jgi:hypothetical protein